MQQHGFPFPSHCFWFWASDPSCVSSLFRHDRNRGLVPPSLSSPFSPSCLLRAPSQRPSIVSSLESSIRLLRALAGASASQRCRQSTLGLLFFFFLTAHHHPISLAFSGHLLAGSSLGSLHTSFTGPRRALIRWPCPWSYEMPPGAASRFSMTRTSRTCSRPPSNRPSRGQWKGTPALTLTPTPVPTMRPPRTIRRCPGLPPRQTPRSCSGQTRTTPTWAPSPSRP
jgi:hypothetical protein